MATPLGFWWCLSSLSAVSSRRINEPTTKDLGTPTNRTLIEGCPFPTQGVVTPFPSCFPILLRAGGSHVCRPEVPQPLRQITAALITIEDYQKPYKNYLKFCSFLNKQAPELLVYRPLARR